MGISWSFTHFWIEVRTLSSCCLLKETYWTLYSNLHLQEEGYEEWLRNRKIVEWLRNRITVEWLWKGLSLKTFTNPIQHSLKALHLVARLEWLLYNKDMCYSIHDLSLIQAYTDDNHNRIHSLWKEWWQGNSIISFSFKFSRQIEHVWSFSSSFAIWDGNSK